MNTKTTWQKVLGGIALTTALVGGSVAVQAEDGVLNEYDANKSGDIDFSEWEAGFDVDPMYTKWDKDRDGKLSKDEYGQGLFESYDQDNDGSWNEDEFKLFQDDTGDDGWLDV